MLIFFSYNAKSQTYTISNIHKVVNGIDGELQGVPGDLFAATLTFSNSSNSKIGIFIDRYQKNLPPYWYSCFCYLSCNVPTRDTISIDVDPLSTRDITVQFKTDSVNPGLATSTLRIHQYGFQNNPQILHLDASTMPSSNVGINELNESLIVTASPNPANKELNIKSESSNISSVKLFNALGFVNYEFKGVNDSRLTIDIEDLPNGVYYLNVQTEMGSLLKRVLKNGGN